MITRNFPAWEEDVRAVLEAEQNKLSWKQFEFKFSEHPEEVEVFGLICHNYDDDEPDWFDIGGCHPDTHECEYLPQFHPRVDSWDWNKAKKLEESVFETCDRLGMSCDTWSEIDDDKEDCIKFSAEIYKAVDEDQDADPSVVLQVVKTIYPEFINYYY